MDKVYSRQKKEPIDKKITTLTYEEIDTYLWRDYGRWTLAI